VNAGPQYHQFIDGFQPEYWTQFAPDASKEEKTEAQKAAETADSAEPDEHPSKKRKESSA